MNPNVQLAVAAPVAPSIRTFAEAEDFLRRGLGTTPGRVDGGIDRARALMRAAGDDGRPVDERTFVRFLVEIVPAIRDVAASGLRVPDRSSRSPPRSRPASSPTATSTTRSSRPGSAAGSTPRMASWHRHCAAR